LIILGANYEQIVSFAIRVSPIIAFFFSFISNKCNAQLCQGSLGDPIVNITFGAGANPGSSLLAATTAYQYVANDCPNDGFYTVRNNTSNCFNSWHNLNADHTGNTDGYFMLVNASVQPGAFYVDTVKGLCSNTTFEFAAWLMNVMRTTACGSNGIQPNLTFTIERTDGTVIQTYNTGNIPSQANPTWQQYGFFFTTPPGVVDVVLRIFNNAQGGCGNDLALDDITFRPCGPQLTPAITGFTSTSVLLCEGIAQNFNFSATVSAGFNNPSFQWQQSNDGISWTDIAGKTTTTFTRNFPANTAIGNYLYRLSAAEAGNISSLKCRVASPVLTIRVVANPTTTTNSNTPICERAVLGLTATGGIQYQWTGVNGFLATGGSTSISNAQLSQSGKYYVLVTNTDGCTHLDSVTVSVNPKPLAATSFSNNTICSGDDIQLTANGGTVYKWLPVTGLSSDIIANPIASPADTLQYMVIVSNQFSCSDTAYIALDVIESPSANAGADKTIITGSPVQLSGIVSGQDVSYSWSPATTINNIQSLRPIVTPPADADYILTVISNLGCGVASDAVHIFVYKDVFIPTAFTPNNDGKNDTWSIPALNAFTNIDMSIYNRAGQVVYQTKNSYRPWDGNYNDVPLPPGAYVYMIDLKQGTGIKKGVVMIIR
jgi:gliding motility-associated-like protein